jgi:GcrA cell cycle regulator
MLRTSGAWTEERVAKLKELWAQGLSGQQIAREFGCTRCAILGKIHRMGLSRGGVVHAAKNAANERKARQARAKKTKPQKIAAPQPEPLSLRKALILSLEPIDASIRVNAVTRRQCRYIHGDPAKQWAFCGRAKQTGSPYCEHHTQLCYVVKQKREQGKVA